MSMQWKYTFKLFLLFFTFLVFSNSGFSWSAPPNNRYKLVFNDEFNGPSLDLTKWMTTYYWGGRINTGTSEIQYYTDDAFNFKNGILSIRADKRNVAGYNYTSGMITTYKSFNQQYGYFEMRGRVPKGKGFWPAFWMLPSTGAWPPEIDIMETTGSLTKNNFMTNIYYANGKNMSNSGPYNGPDFSTSFHTFGLEWVPGRLTWYVDGVKRYQSTTGVPSQKMYLLANLAIGGTWAGYPDATTPFPSTLDIDYIRAYQDPSVH